MSTKRSRSSHLIDRRPRDCSLSSRRAALDFHPRHVGTSVEHRLVVLESAALFRLSAGQGAAVWGLRETSTRPLRLWVSNRDDRRFDGGTDRLQVGCKDSFLPMGPRLVYVSRGEIRRRQMSPAPRRRRSSLTLVASSAGAARVGGG